MNKKSKTVLLFSAFALFIVIAVLAYNNLSKRAPRENISVVQNEEQILAPNESQAPPNRSEASQTGGTTQSSQSKEQEKIAAPDFTVVDVDGNPVKLSDLFGKPIVLNFWASWCGPCKYEMPAFDEVYKQRGEDITFVMVNLVDGQRETKETGARYIAEQGFSFPVYFDTEQEAAYAYGIMSIPTTMFIDKDGYIVAGSQGAIDAETLQRGIDLIK